MHSTPRLLTLSGALAAIVLTLASTDVEGGQADELDESVIEPDYQSWYPKTRTSEKGTVVIYAPQIEGWSDFETMTAWLAFNATRSGGGDTYYGSLRFTARTDTDLANREVLLYDIDVQELIIKGIEEGSPEHTLALEAFTSYSGRTPLDLVLEYLPHEIPLEPTTGLNTEPPGVFVSTEPALLLSVDSDPVFLGIEASELQFVLNTNFDVLRVGDDGPLFLCYQNSWLTAAAIDGPWAWADRLPGALSGLPDDENWTHVRGCLPERFDRLEQGGVAPVVFYTTVPAELLLLDGAPDWAAVGDSDLSYAVNTGQEFFRAANRLYLLLSGRWFAANDLAGPWSYTAKLPESFQQIPRNDEHPKSYIRKSVPGTQEAWEAALVASIPRKAGIARGTETDLDLEVNYGGEPVFQIVEGTDIQMAVNTSYQVFEYQDLFYLCHNAVWLTGSSPNGPWTYADAMPDEFSRIPPSSPAYNTTFVSVAESDWETIQYSYSAGYENAYVSEDTVVHGTGFAVTAASVWLIYEAGWGYPGYPYYPWPPTYGYGSWYDPETGRYGETVVGYGPYGAAAGTAVFNPETGTYARGQAVWDSDEFRGRGYAYNPNTNTSIARNRYVDFEDDEGWSQRVARRGDEWRYTESEWEDDRMHTEFESSRGTEGEINRERDGDTIDSSGNISKGDREATFESERHRDGDQVTGSGSIDGENRSIDFQSEFEDGQGTLSAIGSEGGSGEISRDVGNGEISGSGSFTRDGTTIDSNTSRTAEGVKREFESSEGGQGVSFRQGDENAFAFESGSGDVYAGRDGEVYQKTDAGWSKVDNPQTGGTASSANAERATTNERRERPAQLESTSISASERSEGVAGRYGGSSGSGAGARDYSQLDRDYQSRQRGYDRYSRYRSGGGRSRGGAGRMRR